MKLPKQLTPNPAFINDFINYYARAYMLQRRNHEGFDLRNGCGDALQDHVMIYDTVERKFAGFSNVLRDLHGDLYKPIAGYRDRAQRPLIKSWGMAEWLYVFGVHRMTGSGASFYPATCGDDRHGYKNTCLFELAKCRSVQEMMNALYARLDAGIPTFTCLGNQTPPFPPPPAGSGYRTAGAYYLCDVWPDLNEEIVAMVQNGDSVNGAWSVAEITDQVIQLNTLRGIKRFKFTLTAFGMDLADWYPQHVDPQSRCYYGANCMAAMNAMFSDNNRGKAPWFYDAAMDYLCQTLEAERMHPFVCPMDIEDVACDAVRYWLRFVPRHGYEHLEPWQRESASRVERIYFENFLATAK